MACLVLDVISVFFYLSSEPSPEVNMRMNIFFPSVNIRYILCTVSNHQVTLQRLNLDILSVNKSLQPSYAFSFSLPVQTEKIKVSELFWWYSGLEVAQ